MKILYISRAILPSETSNSLSIMRVCESLAAPGNDVTLCGVRPDRTREDVHAYYGMSRGFHIRTIHFPSFLARPRTHEFLYSYWARHLTRTLKPDVIYSRLCLGELERLPDTVPVIYEMHSPGHVGKSEKRRTRFEALLDTKNIVRIVVTTNYLRDYLLERYPALDVKLARLSAPLPTPLSVEDLADFKAKELRGRGQFDVGYTGFLDNSGLRGTEIICEAAARLPEIDFHVVGGAPEMVTYWSGRVKSSNIHFYGHQNPAKMAGYLGALDVVLAPLQLQISARAPIGANMSPLKLPQYFAYGCSILASNVPAHYETLEHERTALICEANDVDAWVGAIERLRDDPDLRRQLGENARREYHSGYTPEFRVQTILEGMPGHENAGSSLAREQASPADASVPLDPSSPNRGQ